MSRFVLITNTRPTYLRTSTRYQLLPGNKANEVPLEEFQKFEKCKIFDNWKKLGWVRMRMPKEDAPIEELDTVDDQEGSTLEGFTVPEAKKLVLATEDMDLLLQWHAKEKRAQVRNAVTKRIEELNAPDDGEEIFGQGGDN